MWREQPTIENFGKLSSQILLTRLKDERITLVKWDKVITEEKEVIKLFKDHFEKIAETPKIDRPIIWFKWWSRP